MRKTTLWRVQDDRGIGPFMSPHGWAIESMWPIRWRLLTPQQDEGLKAQFNDVVTMGYNKLCAFKDLKQYHACFDTQEAREALHHAGFYLAKYEVEETAAWHGHTQSIFDPDKAKLIAVRACNDSGVMSPIDAVKLKAAQRFLKENYKHG